MQKRQVGKYQLDRELGQGQFGQVYLALDTEDNNKCYAMKVIQKEKLLCSPLLTRLFESEIKIMQVLKHPNLLHLYDILETSNNYYVVTQFCDGGDLETYLESKTFLEVPEAVYFLKQILCGFTELHLKKIMHRDFKLANVFLHQGMAIIGDFGFAKAGVEMTTTRLGTPFNMSPELLLNKNAPYTNKSDIWSIGVVFYQLIYGKLPFPALTLDELKDKVIRYSGSRLYFNENFDTSDEIKELLCRMLEPDVNNRINWSELFSHPVLNDVKTSNFIPQYGASLLGQSKFQARNINEDGLEPIQRREQVNQTFKKDRARAANLSQILVLPDPITLANGGLDELLYEDSQSLSQTSNISEMANSKASMYFCHERNKHLLIFQSAKRARDLSKDKNLGDKGPILIAIALSQLRKGLMMIENNANLIHNSINIYKLPDFDEFCTSLVGTKIKNSFLMDKRTFTDYYKHLYAIGKNSPLDRDTFEKITSESTDVTLLNSAIDKLLINLYKYYIVNRDAMPNITKRALLRAVFYGDLSLYVDNKFSFEQCDNSFDWKDYFAKVERYQDKDLESQLGRYSSSNEAIGKYINNNNR